MFLYQMEPDAVRALRLANMTERVLHRLGDSQQKIWSFEEIQSYIMRAARELSAERIMWDQLYLENLGMGFTHTADFEEEFLDFRLQRANYTGSFEEDLLADAGLEPDLVQQGVYTSPGDIHFLEDAPADTSSPATVELPEKLVEIERATFDNEHIIAANHARVEAHDSRYEITEGDVFAYTWMKDGPRTFRKIRVPNRIGDAYVYNGSWGIARNVDDVTSDTVEGTWGTPRIVAGHHPLGDTEGWGIMRRFYQDGLNVRVDHWRQFAVEADTTGSELPDRYFKYLADYAQWRALFRNGAGQDYKLGQLYHERWKRNVARIKRRIERKDRERLHRAGGDFARLSEGPPRPKLPWQYGSRVR